MSTENKKYRLLRDLPYIKAGIEYVYATWLNDKCSYVPNKTGMKHERFAIHIDWIKDNSEWFKEIKEPHPDEANFKEMIFQRNIHNPYSNEGQSHCAYEKGFEECWQIFFKSNTEPTPTLSVIGDSKEVLLRTEDGVDIFDGEQMLYDISSNNWNFLDKTQARYFKSWENDKSMAHRKCFYSEDKAKEYVLMNKPCLSLQEIFDNSNWYCGDDDKQQNTFYIQHFRKIVQSKIAPK